MYLFLNELINSSISNKVNIKIYIDIYMSHTKNIYLRPQRAFEVHKGVLRLKLWSRIPPPVQDVHEGA